MKKRMGKSQGGELISDLWINPLVNLRGAEGNRAWDNSGNIRPGSGARFLELADIALGVKKPTQKTRKAVGAPASATHHSGKR